MTGLEVLPVGLPVLGSNKFGEALLKLYTFYHLVLPLQLALKIPSHVQLPSGTEIESHKLIRLRMCVGKRYNWSKQCEHVIEKMFKLVDGMNYV